MIADADSFAAADAPSRYLEDPRVAAALQEYQALLDAGLRPDRTEFLSRFPDVAPVLAEAMAGLDFLCEAVHTRPGVGDGYNRLDGRPAPTLLGDFRIVREVGRGGMGVVYEAEQVSLGRRVALKVLPFAAAIDDRQLQRFRTEAQAAAHLHHANIVPVFAVGSDRGVHYYAMQFIDGQTLADMIREIRHAAGPPTGSSVTAAHDPTPLPTERAPAELRPRSGVTAGLPPVGPAYYKALARLGVQAAEALEYAHSMGVVHRDVKPANMLVDPRCNLWVTDFGLAHIHGGSDLTATGDVLGTLRYMSPEQAAGRRGRVDHRTDIYSLGVSLYELFTLREAFPSRERAELLRQIINDDPAPPRRVRRTLPVELETVILKAVAKQPEDRYTSAQELADDLRRFLDDQPVLARRPTMRQVAAKWIRRHSAVVATAAAATVVVAAILAVAVFNLSSKNERLREQTVELERQKTRATENEAYAQKQAAWARKGANAALRAMYNVAGALADEKLKDDPKWGKRAEQFMDTLLTICRDLAGGDGASPDLRQAAVRAGRQVAANYALLGRGEKAKKTYVEVNRWNLSLVHEFSNDFNLRFFLASGRREYGMLLRQLGESKAAAEQLELALDSWNQPHPIEGCPMERSASHDQLGEISAELGKTADAERQFLQAVRLRTELSGWYQVSPNTPEPQRRQMLQMQDLVRRQLLHDVLRLAHLYADTGKTPAAREQFERAINLAQVVTRSGKGDSQDRYYLAQSLRSLATTMEVTDPPAAIQYHRRAAAYFRDLAAEFPGKPECRQALADVHVALGTLCPQDAAEHFRTARVLFVALAADLPDGNPAPGSPGENDNKLAWFLATCPDPQFRDPPRAVEAARRAVKRAPKHADFWNTLGAACYRAGDPAEAVTALKSAIGLRKCGGDAMDWLFLAAAQRQLGQADAARAARSEGLSLIDSRPGAHGNELVRLRTELEQAAADPSAGAH